MAHPDSDDFMSRYINLQLRRLRLDGIKVVVGLKGGLQIASRAGTLDACKRDAGWDGVTRWTSGGLEVDPVARCMALASWQVANDACELLTNLGIDAVLGTHDELPFLRINTIEAGSRRVRVMLAAEPDGDRVFIRIGETRLWPVPYTAASVARIIARACGLQMPDPEPEPDPVPEEETLW